MRLIHSEFESINRERTLTIFIMGRQNLQVVIEIIFATLDGGSAIVGVTVELFHHEFGTHQPIYFNKMFIRVKIWQILNSDNKGIF